MCEAKRYKHTSNPRIDKCLKILVKNLNEYFGDDVEIVGSCCGHGKYPISLIVKEYSPDFRRFVIKDWCSDKIIPRTRKFYKRDRAGYYYLPEVSEAKG